MAARYTVEFDFDVDKWVVGCANFKGKMSWMSHAKIERVLDETFARTQRDVHVITGSLKLSGKKFVAHLPDDNVTWGIEYGGAAPGAVHDPVDYAWFEMRRGGSHDFLTPAITRAEHQFRHVLEESFLEVVGQWR